MTTITLEVPDELAARLAPLRDQLPSLISQAPALRSAEKAATETEQKVSYPVFMETLMQQLEPDNLAALTASLEKKVGMIALLLLLNRARFYLRPATSCPSIYVVLQRFRSVLLRCGLSIAHGQQ